MTVPRVARAAAAGPLLLLLAACGLLRRGGGEAPAASAPSAGGAPAPAAAVAVMPMSATLEGVASPVTGQARLLPGATDAEVRASVTISNSLAGLAHPWSVRAGRCGEAGARRGGAGTYPPLEVRADGTAEATATLPIAMPVNAAHSVAVQRSRSDSTVIACGVLTPGA
jgi:hypothetical protein